LLFLTVAGVIKFNGEQTEATDAKIEECIKLWLKHAAQRHGGSKFTRKVSGT
jgi:hypothetical protein